MNKGLPQQLDRPSLCQLSKEELVEVVIEQATAIAELQKTIFELRQQIQRLQLSRDLDSKASSKPPSGDLLKKPELKKPQSEEESTKQKRKPVGQPGHTGKTRKGFDRVDRYEILQPQICFACGQTEFATVPIKVEKQQVAQLVERPIEIVDPEVPPGNNQAERSLRLAVTKRKVSGGSRSMERFKHTANLLTVVQTCRRQERSVIGFFAQAINAQGEGSQSLPSLVPQS